MNALDDSSEIRWRLHLNSPPFDVYAMVATSSGRARFWVESAVETAGIIEFLFPDGQRWQGKIIEQTSEQRFSVHYYGGSVATFYLADDGHGGTDLLLTDVGVPEAHRPEVMAGWISVLLALKAAVDFGVDLRNHDPDHTWEQGYVGN